MCAIKSVCVCVVKQKTERNACEIDKLMDNNKDVDRERKRIQPFPNQNQKNV